MSEARYADCSWPYPRRPGQLVGDVIIAAVPRQASVGRHFCEHGTVLSMILASRFRGAGRNGGLKRSAQQTP